MFPRLYMWRMIHASEAGAACDPEPRLHAVRYTDTAGSRHLRLKRISLAGRHGTKVSGKAQTEDRRTTRSFCVRDRRRLGNGAASH
jgi:hypothetical protein